MPTMSPAFMVSYKTMRFLYIFIKTMRTDDQASLNMGLGLGLPLWEVPYFTRSADDLDWSIDLLTPALYIDVDGLLGYMDPI